MSDKKPARKLGKGLSALMGDSYGAQMPQGSDLVTLANDSDVVVRELAIASLQAGKYQPRRQFDDAALEELADSIRSKGIMQPIIVRKEGEGFGIIAGERRWRAAKLAGLDTVPAIIRELGDQETLELGIIENVQRKDLGALEEAAGYQRLLDEFGYTQAKLAETVGKSRSHIANLLRLLDLPEAVKTLMDRGDISMGHARAMLKADDPEAIAHAIIDKNLSVRQTETLVRNNGQFDTKEEGPIDSVFDAPTGTSNGLAELTGKVQRSMDQRQSGNTADTASKDPDVVALERSLSRLSGLQVRIDNHGDYGEVCMRYETLQELDRIIKKVNATLEAQS